MDKNAKKSFLSILFVIALDNFGFGLVFMLFAPLILDPSYGMIPHITSNETRNILLGALFMGFPIFQLIGAPIFGDLADQYGRKKALIWTILGTAAGFLLSGIAVTITSFSLLLISRLLTGFFSGNLSICLASIADISPSEKLRSRNFGIMTVVWGASWPFAMLAGGYLSDSTVASFFNAALPFWLSAVLTFLGLWIIFKLFRETHERKENVRFELLKGIRQIKAALEIPAVRPYFLVMLFWTIGWGLTVQWYGSFSILKFAVPQTTISLLLSLEGLFWSLGGSIINPLLLRWFNSRTCALIGYPLLAALLFLAASRDSFFFFNAAYMAAAIISPFVYANSNNLVSINAPAPMQGRIMGLSQSMMSLGWIVVPLLGGWLGGINPSLYYYLGATSIVLGFLVLLTTKKSTQRASS